MNTKQYSVLIADMDNYDGDASELAHAYLSQHPAVECIDFQVPAGLSDDLITLIARGLLWDAKWSSDGSVSAVLENLTQHPDTDGPENYCAGV